MSRNHLFKIGAVLLALSVASGAFAQTPEVTIASWNVRSFEVSNGSGQNLTDDISDYITLLRNTGADIIALNEFETATGRMGRERMSEIASALGMYAYYIESYPKDVGYYGNVIGNKIQQLLTEHLGIGKDLIVALKNKNQEVLPRFRHLSQNSLPHIRPYLH